MTFDLKQDISWFEDEIALSERAIRELEATDPPAEDKRLDALRASLASHEQTLAELREAADAHV